MYTNFETLHNYFKMIFVILHKFIKLQHNTKPTDVFASVWNKNKNISFARMDVLQFDDDQHVFKKLLSYCI